MNIERIAKIEKALLYEGYLLYPYRASSLKNQYRWNIGSLYPNKSLETECLVEGSQQSVLEVSVRFLQVGRQATEITVDLPATTLTEISGTPMTDQKLKCELNVSVKKLQSNVYKIMAAVRNVTVCPSDAHDDELLSRSFLSTHFVLGVQNGYFISLIDPPEKFREVVAACKNRGAWPVLVGEPGQCDMMLASPIILYDYPHVAEETAGDLSDATEIDELLTLRILTMTDQEKKEMQSDQYGAAISKRTESLGHPYLMNVHGAIRKKEDKSLRVGDRVRLRPSKHADIFDMALHGRTAIIESIEQDYEGRLYVAVVLEDDPGRDFGEQKMPAHRFFFAPNEVELLQ